MGQYCSIFAKIIALLFAYVTATPPLQSSGLSLDATHHQPSTDYGNHSTNCHQYWTTITMATAISDNATIVQIPIMLPAITGKYWCTQLPLSLLGTNNAPRSLASSYWYTQLLLLFWVLMIPSPCCKYWCTQDAAINKTIAACSSIFILIR